ncbi:MAG: response regulator [Candidatus Promineifilaceae bacterium]
MDVINRAIKVLIADDHRLIRQALKALLEQDKDIRVVGEATNGEEAVALAQAQEADVFIMDIAMPQMDGIKAAEQIRALKLPVQVLILSMYASSALVEQALKRGARGYLLKRSAAEELLPAVQQVHNGRVFVSESLSKLSSS